jgi:hypothetical protein
MSSIKSARITGHTHSANRAFVGESGSEPCRDSVAVIMDFVPMTFTQYEQMVDQLKAQRDGPLSSALFHWYRVQPDGIRVIEIWPSRSTFTSFLDNVLQPLVKTLGLPEPHLSCHDVPRVAHHE